MAFRIGCGISMAGDCHACRILGAFMNSCDAYRTNAEACAKLAEGVEDPYIKLVLLKMAEGWLRLASYVELRKQNEMEEHFDARSSPDRDASPK